MTSLSDGVVVVTVQAPLTRERVDTLRHAALAQLARHPRILIAEFAPASLAVQPEEPLSDLAVAVLTEVAREAGIVDIGLCLVVPPDHVAHRAIDAMHAHPGRPFTPADLAQIGGCSVHSLQEGFRLHIGLSPMRYLRQIRLEHAHHELAAADPRQTTVTDVAYQWGFTHLGRFASTYSAKYGRSPARPEAAEPRSAPDPRG